MDLQTIDEVIAPFKLEIKSHGERRREISLNADSVGNSSTREPRYTIWSRKHYFTRGDRVYGNVYLDQSAAGKLRVVKEIVHPHDSGSADRDKRRCTELEMMARVATVLRPDQKRYFVDFLGWFEGEDRLGLVLEYCPLGDVEHCFAEPLPEQIVRIMTAQILEGLAILHRLGITHRDIKPQNILVFQKDPVWVKIADFGISKRNNGQTDLRSKVGTEGYMAPEILLDETKRISKYSNAVDMWSLGCLIYYLLSKKVPFPSFLRLKEYYEGFGVFPDDELSQRGVGESGISFIRCLMDSEPEKRPVASAQLATQWSIVGPEIVALTREQDLVNVSGEIRTATPAETAHTTAKIQSIVPAREEEPNYWSSELLRITKTPHLPEAEDRTRALLESDANPNAMRDGYTPLHHACEAGSPKLVQLLLQYAADVHIRTQPHGETPLHLATYRGDADSFLKILHLLVPCGVEVNAVDNVGTTALHSVVARVGGPGAVSAIEALIALGASTEIRGTARAVTPLQYAVALDREEKAAALIRGGANVNVEDRSGRRVLHEAIVSRKISAKLVEMLIEKGADVNAKDSQGVFPMYEAVRADRPEIVHLLVKHEADTILGSESIEWRLQWMLFQRKLPWPLRR
ncbi:kinase-like protein [Aspergillus saccharolyticus JOP 1030-1]|uniref:mitogen-activated protein kinase n=1 Tax=Aspergillus saccharolyticus JOP 1030-1 TaxID=1450539 RepID=A0A318ZNI7_9EURO|nr:kinase-like protein [Aspergillus saccharolyticus JOP 1030-1]PYH41658.1 kinase-like protein [Aspergillus saccharolyticus JOP 1030-1]